MLDCISSFFVFSKQICFLNASRCPNWQIFSFQTKNFFSNRYILLGKTLYFYGTKSHGF